jgi:hypothetical protein
MYQSLHPGKPTAPLFRSGAVLICYSTAWGMDRFGRMHIGKTAVRPLVTQRSHRHICLQTCCSCGVTKHCVLRIPRLGARGSGLYRVFGPAGLRQLSLRVPDAQEGAFSGRRPERALFLELCALVIIVGRFGCLRRRTRDPLHLYPYPRSEAGRQASSRGTGDRAAQQDHLST